MTEPQSYKKHILQHIERHKESWKHQPMREILYDFAQNDTFDWKLPQIPFHELLLVHQEHDDLIQRWIHEVMHDPCIQIPVNQHGLLNHSCFMNNNALLELHFTAWAYDPAFFKKATAPFITSPWDEDIIFAKKMHEYGYPIHWEEVFPTMTNAIEIKRLASQMPSSEIQKLFQSSFQRVHIPHGQMEYFACVDKLALEHNIPFQETYLEEPAGMTRRPRSRRLDQYSVDYLDPTKGTTNIHQQYRYQQYLRNRRYTPIAVYHAGLSYRASYVWYDPNATPREKAIAWTIQNSLPSSNKEENPYEKDPSWNDVVQECSNIEPYLLPLTMNLSWANCLAFWKDLHDLPKSLDDPKFIL